MHRVSQSCTSLVLSVTNGNTFFRILPIFQRLQLNRKPSRVAKEKREKKKKKKQELEQLQLFLSGGKTSARFFSRDHLHSRRNATVQSPGRCSWNRGGADLPRDETRRDETRRDESVAAISREGERSRASSTARISIDQREREREGEREKKLPAAKQALAVYESVNWPG